MFDETAYRCIQLNVFVLGSGPLTLVFLPYFGGSALEWRVIMATLSDQYHCVAVDLRGFGHKSEGSRWTDRHYYVIRSLDPYESSYD